MTVHDDELAFLRLFRMRARVMPGLVSDATDIILGCYAVAVEQDADLLEEMYRILDEVGTLVLNKDEITDRVMRDHMERRINAGYHLWGLLTLFLWMKRWKVEILPPAPVVQQTPAQVFATN